MSIQVNRLTNANIYVDGNSYLGRAEEITLPTISHKMAEHKALGMVGVAEFFAGIEKMAAKVKWNAFYRDALVKVADPTKSLKLQVRSSLETYSGEGRIAQVPAVVYMTAQAKDFPGGNYKQHDNVEVETNFVVYSFKMEINGEEIVEYDVLNNIYKVNGVDMLETYRTNLGL